MNRIFKYMFRKEIDKYNKQYEKYIEKKEQDCKNAVKLIEEESSKKLQQFNLIKRIFNVDRGAAIVGMKLNKNDEELIITERVTKDSVDVKLYGFSYQGVSHLPRILGNLNKTYGKEALVPYIRIEDIRSIHNDIGNGSIMMEHYINLAKSLGVYYIDGLLSSVDKDHFERSEHFYKKFDFEVSFNEERTSGSIKLNL